MRFCDLHTHSVYSDGTSTPAELIAGAKEAGLAAIALTDHNTVAGLPPFLDAAEGSGQRKKREGCTGEDEGKKRKAMFPDQNGQNRT